MYDVIIVGGGPAGLSAALVLARARRSVMICDSGHPRNCASPQLGGFLSRDGIHPGELLRLGREEVLRYGAQIRQTLVIAARCLSPADRPDPQAGFEVTLENNERLASRKLLLATGMTDVLPPLEGIGRYYGRAVHHCPYCDGWEHRDERLAAYGLGTPAVGLALALRTWSDRVTACTHGVRLQIEDRRRLERNSIACREERIVRLEGTGERLERLVFEAGPPLPCDALFFNTEQYQRSNLPAMLGCKYTHEGKIDTQAKQRTGVPGLYLAGDADGDVQFTIVAAAEGATAAVAINRELQDEDRGETREAGERP